MVSDQSTAIRGDKCESPGRTGACAHISYVTQDIVRLRLCPWEAETKME